MTINNSTLRDWLALYEDHHEEFPEIGVTSEEFYRLHRIDSHRNPDDVLSGLKDFPFAGVCTVRFGAGGGAIVEVYHQFFKLLPNGVKFDSEFENMYCIRGLSRDNNGEKPQGVEFGPKLADTIQRSGERASTPTLIDFMKVGAKEMDSVNLKAPDDVTKAHEEANRLKHPAPSVQPRKMFGIIPPFLMHCFGNTAGSPLLTLLHLLPEIHAYTAKYLDEEGTLAMWAALYPMLQRLWLAEEEEEAGKDNGRHFFIIDPLPITTNERALKEGENLEKKYSVFVPMSPSGTQPVPESVQTHKTSQDAIDGNYDSFFERNAKMISMAFDKEEKGKGFKRLTASNRKYILFASASADRKLPESPNEEFKEFLDLKKEQALSYMQASIIAQRSGSQVIDLAIASTLWGGTLYNANHHGPPMSMSIFFAVPAPLIGGEAEMTQDEFDLRKDSNNLSLAQIKSATHSQVQIPKDDNEFKATLENFLCIVDFVLGKDSFVYAKLNILLKAIEKNKGAFKAVTTFDSKFVASLMQAIDIKVKIFIESCAKELLFSNVNFGIVDFTEEVNCILTRKSIGIALPPLIQQVLDGGSKSGRNQAAKHGKRPNHDSTDHEETNPKRKALSAHKNDAPIKESWMKKGENFQIFKEQMKTVPSHQGNPICVKYHVKGVCTYGDGCQRKLTHTNKFDEATTAAFDAWVTKCRRLAGN
jgi:hypothetical protein